MTPPIRRRDTGRQPTSARLRALRKGLEPEPSQEDIAAKLGEGQMWISRRERGVPEPSADEAILIAEALGYAAELVIVDREQRELLAGLGRAGPAETALALRLLAVLPYFDETARTVLEGLLRIAEQKAAEAAAAG